MTTAVSDLAAQLAHGAVDVLPTGGIEKVLERAAKEDRPLRVKLGLDPTAPDIHLGHCVVLQKLRQFQDLGHTAVLIVGDYTARVGDPTGRSKTRPVLTDEEIDANAITYQEQAFRILDPERTEVRRNSEWLSAMRPDELFGLMRHATVARILERDDFSKRFAAGAPISVLELLYPLLQGYDSVMIDADLEMGGTDQLYNLLVGRDLQAAYGKPQQAVLTTPILVGTDGERRMGKSIGNYVGVAEPPSEQFGKTMSIPDEAMPEWIRYATGFDAATAQALIDELAAGAHPGEMKRRLAAAVVARFYGADAAREAEAAFDALFRRHETPDDVPEVPLSEIAVNDAGRIFLPALLTAHMGEASNGAARRLITQGALKIDGEPWPADALELDPADLSGRLLQLGKRRFLRITG